MELFNLSFDPAHAKVITPLMQLSALWMLPFSTSAASLGFAPVIRPLHLVAVPELPLAHERNP